MPDRDRFRRLGGLIGEDTEDPRLPRTGSGGLKAVFKLCFSWSVTSSRYGNRKLIKPLVTPLSTPHAKLENTDFTALPAAAEI
jgi:hypothetical protein